MDKKERALSALMAVFPNVDSYLQFIEHSDNHDVLQSFIEFAYANEIIDTANENTLRETIDEHARSHEMCIPPKNLNFEVFFDQKEVLLELNLSARALTNRINSLISEHEIQLPNVSNSMITRFKKEPADTPHKLNVLRSFAFWMGYDRAHLGPRWNFETLVRLCSDSKPQTDYKEGVRIGFALYGRGDVIDHEIVGWLKKEVKSYTEESIGRYNYGRWGKVRAHDITTLYVDFPKENKVGNPASYRQCLRSTMSLAHQIAIRWSLSKYYSQNRFLSIGLAVGSFSNLDNHLLPILNAKLPGDPVIRLTDYARQCTLINDIRVILNKKPAETSLFNDETLTIWWVMGFWNMLYFDFIPDLLADPLLQNDFSSNIKLTQTLWAPANRAIESLDDETPNAISTFFRYPHNSLLGLEIAKTLFYRRRYWEAIEVVRIVLSLDPAHVVARTFNMVLLRSLATDAPNIDISKKLFKEVYHQAEYIKTTNLVSSEDFYCEYATVFLAEALTILRFMRHSPVEELVDCTHDALKKKVYYCLDQAELNFSFGFRISPNGSRAVYFFNLPKILRCILKQNEAIFTDASQPYDAEPHVLKKALRDYQWQFSYLREGVPQNGQYELYENIFKFMTYNTNEAISLHAYRPSLYFGLASVWWDLFPVRTVSIARRTLQLLQDAVATAREIEKLDTCIYSFTRTCGEMIPVSQFIIHVEKAFDMVAEIAGPDLHKRPGNEVIEPDKMMGLLISLNFE